MTTARRTATDTIAQIAGRLGAAGATVIALRLATTHLGTTAYGTVVAVLAIVGLAIGIADFGLTAVVTRELAIDGSTASRTTGAALGMRIAIGVVSTPIVVAVAALGFGPRSPIVVGVILACPMLLLASIDVVSRGVFAARGRNKVPALVDATVSIAAVVPLWLVLRAGGGTTGFLLVTVVTAGVTGGLIFWAAHVRPGRLVDVAEWRRLFVLALPLGVVTLINVVYLRLDGLLLALWRPRAEVGLYGLAYRVIELVIALPSFFMLSLFPLFAVASVDERERLARRALDVLLTVGIAMGVGSVLLAPWVVRVLGGAAFDDAGTPLALLAVGASASYATALFGNVLVALGKQKALLPVGLAVGGANLVFNLVAIPSFGVNGAAAAASASEVLALVLAATVARRRAGIRPAPWHVIRVVPGGMAMVAAHHLVRTTRLGDRDLIGLIGQVTLLGSAFLLVCLLTGGLRPLAALMPTRRRAPS
jgi:O-antigen/teichoic acid export membrane protein